MARAAGDVSRFAAIVVLLLLDLLAHAIRRSRNRCV
jgi:hypothetical protein